MLPQTDSLVGWFNLLALTIVNIDANASLLQKSLKLLNFLRVLRLILGGHLGCNTNRDEDGLNLGHARRENKPLIIPVQHDHDSDDAS